jgi:hypothetical protein
MNFSSFVKKKKAPEAPPSVRRSLIVRLNELWGKRCEGGERRDGPSRDIVVIVHAGAVADLSEVEGLVLHELHRGVVLTLEGEDGGEGARPREERLEIGPVPGVA